MQYRGMKDVLDFFTSRERIFKFFDNRHLLDWMGDEPYLKLAFRAKMGYPLDLKNPRTFSEKLQWLKLHDRKPLYTTLVDKYAVRQYIAEKIGEEYLIPLVGGPWNSAEEIDFDALPEQFVLKCNHDSGGVIVCRDKSELDIPVKYIGIQFIERFAVGIGQIHNDQIVLLPGTLQILIGIHIVNGKLIRLQTVLIDGRNIFIGGTNSDHVCIQVY